MKEHTGLIHVICGGCGAVEALPTLDKLKGMGWTFTQPRGVRCPGCSRAYCRYCGGDLEEADRHKGYHYSCASLAGGEGP